MKSECNACHGSAPPLQVRQLPPFALGTPHIACALPQQLYPALPAPSQRIASPKSWSVETNGEALAEGHPWTQPPCARTHARTHTRTHTQPPPPHTHTPDRRVPAHSRAHTHLCLWPGGHPAFHRTDSKQRGYEVYSAAPGAGGGFRTQRRKKSSK